MRIFRGILAAILLLAGGQVVAQEQLHVTTGQDTIRYRYTPIDNDHMTAETTARPSFLRRVVGYFEQAAVDRSHEKRIDLSFFPGIGYAATTNFKIGGMLAGVYRLDSNDTITAPSDVMLLATVSINGSYLIEAGGNNFFRENRDRLSYTITYRSQPTNYWGIGYEAGAYNPSGLFVEKRLLAQFRYLHRIAHHTFLGLSAGFHHTQGIRFTRPEYIEGQAKHQTATSIGAIAEYDSRDHLASPQRGQYLSLQAAWLPRALGSQAQGLWQANITFNTYTPLWRDATLATNLYAEFHAEGTPWSMTARMGGAQSLRGYYEGRYNDNNLASVQVELRQRIWRQLGAVAWIGAGNVFQRFDSFEWRETLPSYGIGLRWEFKNRTNVRVDVGFGRKSWDVVLQIGEAF